MIRSQIGDRRGEWFQIWEDDKNAMIETMWNNMEADIKAGYDPFGAVIRKQLEDINEYHEKLDAQMGEFWKMTDEEVDRWCFYDLKRRGAI